MKGRTDTRVCNRYHDPLAPSLHFISVKRQVSELLMFRGAYQMRENTILLLADKGTGYSEVKWATRVCELFRSIASFD